MNEFVSWCRHLLVSFLFHAVTSIHPPSFHRNDFSTCSIHFSFFILGQSPNKNDLLRAHNITFHLPWVYRRWKEGEGHEYRSDLKLLCNDRPKMNIESEQQMQASVISWVVTVSSEWSDRKWEQME